MSIDTIGRQLLDHVASKDRDEAEPCLDGFCHQGQQDSLEKTQAMISTVIDEIEHLLLSKNRKYGDSAIHPVRIFSTANPVEQLNVRIDDKISRILSAQDDDTEDPEFDMIGYLILKRVARRLHGRQADTGEMNE